MINLKDIARTAHNLQPILHVGKNGITSGLIEEIKQLLKKKKVIKIKLNRSIVDVHDRKELAKEISSLTGSQLVNLTGNNLVLLWKGNGNRA